MATTYDDTLQDIIAAHASVSRLLRENDSEATRKTREGLQTTRAELSCALDTFRQIDSLELPQPEAR